MTNNATKIAQEKIEEQQIMQFVDDYLDKKIQPTSLLSAGYTKKE